MNIDRWPIIRPARPSWWERNAPLALFVGAMAALAVLDILGI
jgi:hypothetical protein